MGRKTERMEMRPGEKGQRQGPSSYSSDDSQGVRARGTAAA